MPVYEEYVRDRHEEACHKRGDAEGRLIDDLDNGDAVAAAVAEVARARAEAAWWQRVVTAIDGEGVDPVDAVARARQSARAVLTHHPIVRTACPFETGFALAQIEGARTFYLTTAYLEEITTRRAS